MAVNETQIMRDALLFSRYGSHVCYKALCAAYNISNDELNLFLAGRNLYNYFLSQNDCTLINE